MFMLCFVLLFVLSIEASTNIISKSDIFKPFRAFLFKHSPTNIIAKFLHMMLDCPYCTSVWVSLIHMLLYFSGVWLIVYMFMFFMFVMVFHRLSNIVHHVIDRIDKNSGYDVLLDKEN